jgi:CRP/FNR family transcriptional regulator, cyclic AMP receptor protein
MAMLKPEEIRKYKLFSGLEDDELTHIAKLCTRRIYERGTVVFGPETPTSEIYVIEEGTDVLVIEVPINNEEKIVIHTLSKGEAFGWLSMGKPYIKTAIARCIDRATIICIEVDRLKQLLEADKNTGYQVMKNLVEIISSRLSFTTVVFRNEIKKLKGKA